MMDGQKIALVVLFCLLLAFVLVLVSIVINGKAAREVKKVEESIAKKKTYALWCRITKNPHKLSFGDWDHLLHYGLIETIGAKNGQAVRQN